MSDLQDGSAYRSYVPATATDPEEEPLVLNEAVVQRVWEGVAAARDPLVRRWTDETLERLGAIAPDHPDPHLPGAVRRWVLRIVLRTLLNVRVEGTEHIPRGPAVLAPNHLSHMDPFLLLAELPAKPFYYVLGDARTLYNKRWKRWILRLASGIIPLERRWREENAVLAATNRPDLAELAAAIEEHVPTGSSIQALRQLDQVMQALLSAGHGILLFPEGRLGTQEASLHTPLKRGTVNYALRAKVPIVPAVLIGTRDLYFRKQVILRFGPPLQFDPNQRFSRELSQTATEALEKALLEMLPVIYEDPAEPKPLGQWLNRLFW